MLNEMQKYSPLLFLGIIKYLVECWHLNDGNHGSRAASACTEGGDKRLKAKSVKV